MSIDNQNKFIKTVSFEIHPEGNCRECESKRFSKSFYCRAFDCDTMTLGNCQECKDYLAEMKSRVSCLGCFNFKEKIVNGETITNCSKGKIQKFGLCKGRTFKYWYSVNCKEKTNETSNSSNL